MGSNNKPFVQFSTQKEFEDAVMKVIRKRLDITISTDTDSGADKYVEVSLLDQNWKPYYDYPTPFSTDQDYY